MTGVKIEHGTVRLVSGGKRDAVRYTYSDGRVDVRYRTSGVNTLRRRDTSSTRDATPAVAATFEPKGSDQ